MPRYSQDYFGGGLYGATPTENWNLWSFLVDWDGSGTFAGLPDTFNNEALRMVNLSVTRGRDYLLRRDGQGIEPYNIGEATAVLDNEDGRYDVYNTSSPLYPYIRPGKKMRIAVQDGTGGTSYGVMRGVIDDIQPVMVNGKPRVRILVKDGGRWLADQTPVVGLTTSQRVDECMEDVLTAADWPSTEWPISFSNSMTTLDYFWTFKKKATDVVKQLEDCEIGVFFHDRDGNATFRGRDYTHNRTKAVAQSEILRDIILPQPWEIIRNQVLVNVYPKSLDTDVDFATGLFYLREVLGPIAASGGTLTFDALFREIRRVGGGPTPKTTLNNACGTNAIVTFTVNAQADGLGADLTGSCTCTLGDVADGVEVTVTNNSGTPGYLVFFRINGDAYYPTDVSLAKASDATSIADYGPRSLVIDSYWQENGNTAQEIADWLLGVFKAPTLYPTIQFEGRPDYQFYLDLYDRVELSIAAKSISANFRVGRIEHTWLNQNGTAVRTQVKLEPYLTPFS